MKNKNEIILYQNQNGEIKLEVSVLEETVWLNRNQMALLFDRDVKTIGKHINNIFNEGELVENAVVANFATTANDGKIYQVDHYNLDVIISVGYRVKSQQGTQFRIWATTRLKEYIIKGFTMDDERLKSSGGGNYWKELLDRIRDIRSSEKVLYRQVLDLYATSVDYNPKSTESFSFFKAIQNKLHYAAHGHTAAEIIAKRADAGKTFMGLLSFAGKAVQKKDIAIAKNYLSEKELKVLNNIVSAYFDLAEVKAMDEESMTMQDWLMQFDKLISAFDKKVLTNAGKISHNQAVEKAEKEYRQYQVKTLSPVEKAYLDSIKTVQKKIEKKAKDENRHD
ncbi:MAG: virulence RhuM family protein [Kiritimatiellae bacterium]|jgi:hypothetical protein|nr:virulence RhuM family protein [Kiritimatiellia bacterium]